MKNIQVIDGAENCTFPIFQATDEEFALLFPGKGQDIQFSDELKGHVSRALQALWQRPVWKADIQGTHGTLFYGFEKKRHHFPATRREYDWDESSINEAQRVLHRFQREQAQ